MKARRKVEKWSRVVGALEGTDKSGSIREGRIHDKGRERCEINERPLLPETSPEVLKEDTKIYIA